MAESRAKVEKGADEARPTQSSPEKTPEERRFTADELQVDARPRLGVSPATVAGALAGKGEKKTYTLDEAEKLVNEFLDREVVPA